MLHFNQRHPLNDWSSENCHFICSEGKCDYWLYKDNDINGANGHFGLLITVEDYETGSYHTIQLSHYLNEKWFTPDKNKYRGQNIIDRLFKLILKHKVLEFNENQFRFRPANYYTLRQIIAKRDHQSPEIIMELFSKQMDIITNGIATITLKGANDVN